MEVSNGKYNKNGRYTNGKFDKNGRFCEMKLNSFKFYRKDEFTTNEYVADLFIKTVEKLVKDNDLSNIPIGQDLTFSIGECDILCINRTKTALFIGLNNIAIEFLDDDTKDILNLVSDKLLDYTKEIC